MAFEPENRFELRTGQMNAAEAAAAEIDVGLRQYMLSIYNYMASGLTLTGIVAYGVSTSEAAMQAIYGTPLMWVVMLSPFAFILALSFGIHKMKASTAQAVFWGFSAVMGLSLASIFIIYTGASITRVFFITAGTFAGMSLYGYTTKKDLTGWGSFLFMGLIGIIIAMVVNLMHMKWVFLPRVAAATTFSSLVLVLIAGFAGAWLALGRKAAPYLRNE